MATFTKEFSSKLCKTIRYCFWRICTLCTRKYSIHSADLVLQNSNQSWEVSQTNNTAKNDLICGVLFIFLMQLMSQEGREGLQKMWISLVFYQTWISFLFRCNTLVFLSYVKAIYDFTLFVIDINPNRSISPFDHFHPFPGLMWSYDGFWWEESKCWQILSTKEVQATQPLIF